MNKHHIELVEMLKMHLKQEVSRHEMRNWLIENIRPKIDPRSGGLSKPGLALEFYVQRLLRSYMDDIDNPLFPKKSPPNLNWYWEKVAEMLDLLLGNKIYRTSGTYIEYPLEDQRRKYDEWLLPYLQHAEAVFQKLVADQTSEDANGELLELDIPLENRSLASQTNGELLMCEILNTIKDYNYLINNFTNSLDQPLSQDEKSALIERLRKLLRCFKGEAYYSLSVTFEGLDKFAITIVT